jgi:hypothetical protein
MAVLGDSAVQAGTVCRAPLTAKEPDLAQRAGIVLQALPLLKDLGLAMPELSLLALLNFPRALSVRLSHTACLARPVA